MASLLGKFQLVILVGAVLGGIFEDVLLRILPLPNGECGAAHWVTCVRNYEAADVEVRWMVVHYLMGIYQSVRKILIFHSLIIFGGFRNTKIIQMCIEF